ncbi:hypothetical protein NHH03_27865, partial [Stieleria sp. TO1_6]|nr:hypothetical protein [Stieleria tagensis]
PAEPCRYPNENPQYATMATASDEIQPSSELIAAILDDAVTPRFEDFERDGCPPLFANVVVAVRESLTSKGTFCTASLPNYDVNGELRIRVRKTGSPMRVIWRVESLFPAIMPETGFVGFDARGDARLAGKHWAIQTKGWQGKYNVCEWAGWN